MGVRKAEVEIHTCDGGCGTERISETDDPVEGVSLSWVQVDGTGGFGGSLWTCGTERCITRALRNRLTIQRDKEEEARR